jgi:hypothetical protein
MPICRIVSHAVEPVPGNMPASVGRKAAGTEVHIVADDDRALVSRLPADTGDRWPSDVGEAAR